MTSRFTLRILTVLVSFFLLFSGCVPITPPAHMPPTPSEVVSGSLVRVIPMPREAIFPKILDVLVDLGYQVRSVNQDLGQINIRRDWSEFRSNGTGIKNSLEATLLFRQEGPQSTRVRIFADYLSLFGDRLVVDSTQSQKLLQDIENALRTKQ